MDTDSTAEKNSEKEGEKNSMKTLSKAAWLAAAERAEKWPEKNGYLYFLHHSRICTYSKVEEFLKTCPQEAAKEG